MWSIIKSIPIIAKLLDNILAWWRDYSKKLDEIRAESRLEAKDKEVDDAIAAVLNPPDERLSERSVEQLEKVDGAS